jgi:hypothetical protein
LIIVSTTIRACQIAVTTPTTRADEQLAFGLIIKKGIDTKVATIRDFSCYKTFNCTAIDNCYNEELNYQDKPDYFNSTIHRGFESTIIVVNNRDFSQNIITTIIVEDKG